MLFERLKVNISQLLYGWAVKLNPNLRFDNVVIEHTYLNVIPVVTKELEEHFVPGSILSGNAALKIRLSNMILARIRPYIEYSTYCINGRNVHEARINIVTFNKKQHHGKTSYNV